MPHFGLETYILISLLLVVAGLAAGFLGAFFGVGGGTVLVPILLTVYTHIDPAKVVDMHQAIAASLALVIFSTLAASYKHYKVGNVDIQFFKGWIISIVVGCIIGSVVMAYVSSLALKILFTGYLFLAVIYQALKKDATKDDHQTLLPSGLSKNIGGIVIGGLSVLLGLAGGTFTTPYLTFYGYPIKKAMGISVTSGILIGLIGTIAAIINGLDISGRLPLSLGYVNILTVILVAPFVMLSSPWGVKLSCKVPSKKLHFWYIIFLFFLGCYMLYHLLRHSL